MSNYRIRFSATRVLYFRARLDEVKKRTLDDAFMDGALEAWRERKIHTVVVFSDSPESILRDRDRPDFEFVRISPTLLTSGDYESLYRLNQEIQLHLSRHSVLFLYSNQDAAAVLNYAAMFYMQTKKDAQAEPGWTVNRLTGRDAYEPGDRGIYEFKKFISPEYEVPDFVNNGASSPSPESPSATLASAAGVITASDNAVVPKTEPKTEPETRTENETIEATGTDTGETSVQETINVPANVQSDTDADTPATPEPEVLAPAETPSAIPVPVPVDEPITTPLPVPVSAPVNVPEPAKTEALEPGLEPAPGANGEKKFKLSKFTIRVKMLGIISAILVGSMSLMIAIATVNFSRSIQDRVEADNFKLINIIGEKTTSEFNNLLQNAGELATAKSGERFFRNNPQVIFGGLAVVEGEGLRFTRKFYNPGYLKKEELTTAKIDTLHEINGPSFTKSFAGAIVARNISPGFPVPALGLSRPSPFGSNIIVLYVDADKFLASFAKSGKDDVIQLFMVDASGDVIAHPDEAKVRSRSNLANVGIVSAMLKSKSKSKKTEYTDEDGVLWLGNYKKLDFADVGIIATAKRDDVFEAVRYVQTINILILIIVVMFALIIIYFFARTITNPIRQLVTATEEVDRGNFTVRMQPDRNDELGQLTQSFSQMTAGLEQGEKVKDVMARMSNKVIVELAAQGKLALGGQYKHAAVFFSDLRGFTAMSETMTPEEVVIFLNDYFTDMVRCVVDTNGVVDKFIGDAIMAHWGAIPSPGNVTESAVNAALLMRGALIKFNALNALERPIAKMGCGINTGDVISGQIGSSERYEYTVIGDAVNLASRIEALNKPFGTDVLISQDSYDLVRDLYVVEKMPAIKVKGKSEPQTIYAVVRRTDDPEGPKDMNEVRQLVGIDWKSDKKLGDVLEEDKEEKFEVLE